jgi:tRNA(adenine34) deaminase
MNKDEHYIKRCFKLAESSIESGELPYGSLIVWRDSIISESGQQVRKERDVTKHAEIIVLVAARRILDIEELRNCTIYSNVEPCPMCSFIIRELGIARVVFANYSSMGGYIKFPILQDEELAKKEPFWNIPEVVGGVLNEEGQKLWVKFEGNFRKK